MNIKKSVSKKVESQSTGITTRTFCNRLYKCYYFKEKKVYLKEIRLLFEKILNKYKDEQLSIIEIYARELSNRSSAGIRRITVKEREEFRNLCTTCIINISNLFDAYRITNIHDKYCYKWVLKGYISGVLHSSKSYNLWLSFENASLVQKDLDFVMLNSYIYNITHNVSNDALVMSVPTNTFFLVPYNERDYTIRRGFLTITKGNALRKRGEHCLQCSNTCNPMWINGLNRLESIV